ncbi:hypothetical protein [Bradyrhizobium sp. USDA 10063]
MDAAVAATQALAPMMRSGKACSKVWSCCIDCPCSTRPVFARMDRAADFAYDTTVPPDVIALMGRGMMRRGPVFQVTGPRSFCFWVVHGCRHPGRADLASPGIFLTPLFQLAIDQRSS